MFVSIMCATLCVASPAKAQDFGGALLGGIIGGTLGGIIAPQFQRPQPRYYRQQPRYYQPQPQYAPQPYYDPQTVYCMQRFRSYRPETGYYTGYDGYLHHCP